MTKRRWDLLVLAAFILLAAFLRFYHITRLEFFTYDQARDALYVMRMVKNGELRLLGTQTSLPGMYLPPFYYYTIAPILWLWRYNPIGIDIYSALIGVLTVPLVYLVGNRVFGKPAGLFSAGLFAVSPLVVELTRRAWNPNTLPFFILLAFYFLYNWFKEGRQRDFLLALAFYGYCLSLHFGAWTLLPLIFFSGVYGLIKKKLGRLGFLGGLGILLFFVSPLLAFEVRHNFFLSKQAKTFFFDGGHVGIDLASLPESFLVSLVSIFTVLVSAKITVGYGAPLEFGNQLKDIFRVSQSISVVAQKPFSITFQWWGIVIFLGILLMSLFSLFRKKEHGENDTGPMLGLKLIWVWVIWGVIASKLYVGKFFFFYYLYLFPAPILLFGWLLSELRRVNRLAWLSTVVIVLIVFFHLKNTTIVASGWRDINDLETVGKMIAEKVPRDRSFNIATVQRDLDRWDRNAVDYRYFVELNGRRALDWYPEDYSQASYLLVVDETSEAEILASPIMEIQQFCPKEIVDSWEVNKGVKLYLLDKCDK